jgi:tripartite-type tricarboxylate transporter receptor subunit TctC
MLTRFSCKRNVPVACLLLAAAWSIALPAGAQTYPSKPVRLIIPFPPGGSNDIVGRMIAMQLTERLGTQVVVDNRGGAGGIIGTEIAAKSQPDGHTLLIISIAYAFNPSLYKHLSFDPVKSFAPVAMLGTGPNVLAVFPGLPAKSVKELIALAKQKPGQLNYAAAGVGTFQHLSSELFRIMAGVDIVTVQFKGGGPATIDVIAGHTQISMGSLIQTLTFIRSGRLRALGTGGLKRTAILPDVPTIAEGLPGYEANNWWGILAPAGTPRPIINRLHQEVSEILKSAETQKRFSSEGAESVQMAPAEFGKFIAAETVKWARVVKSANIRAE